MSLYMGIDSGSTASKCVIVDENGAVVARGLYPAGVGTGGAETARDLALAQAGASLEQVAKVCATGYGRKLVQWADFELSELTCHAKGVAYLEPSVRTVIDIGGQDAKVLRINEQGMLENFVMNDKCAAGTGRFLDVMASIIGKKASDLSDVDKLSTSPASISSTCTVFAESEVISKMASGVALPDVVAGVHESVVERTVGLARRAGIVPTVVMTGGVALNESLRLRLEAKLGVELAAIDHPQFAGALGAALTAKNKG